MLNPRFVRADSGMEVDYLTFLMMSDGNATVSIYTEDDSLQGSTVSYDLLLDLTDGQVDMHVTTASVTYIAAPPSENSAPYFDPELTGMIQIYK